MIPESTIETAIARLEEQPEKYEEAVEGFTLRQPTAVAYLFSDSFDLLTPGERDLLLYLSLVVWKSVEAVHPDRPEITQEQIGNAEERGWEMLENSSAKRFRDRLDPFFEASRQEDLLAFVEDSLSIDDEEEENPFQLTKEGREPIFVAVNSLIYCLTS